MTAQTFAGVATIRAAIFDVIDHGDEDDQPWMFYENIENPLSTYDQSMADFDRSRFADAVIKRIGELKEPPHDGVKLENLCDLHKRRALPRPTSQVCLMCERRVGI